MIPVHFCAGRAAALEDKIKMLFGDLPRCRASFCNGADGFRLPPSNLEFTFTP